ncbi:MAG: GNAT family N-acetyltransferase [Thermoplasmata archaeon]|nr:GNAT family N-acetyltransferase [Thermoplasmata archaeon]
MSGMESSILDIGSWENILRLYRLCDSDFVLPLSVREIGAEEMMQGVFEAGEYLGGFLDGIFVSCGGYRTFGKEQAEVHGIVVRPDYRKRGLGREITEAVLKRAKEKGVREIEVSTWEGSIGLDMFFSVGFIEVERFPDPEKRPAGVRTVRLVKEMRK